MKRKMPAKILFLSGHLLYLGPWNARKRSWNTLWALGTEPPALSGTPQASGLRSSALVYLAEVFEELGAKELVLIFRISGIHLPAIVFRSVKALGLLPLLQRLVGIGDPRSAFADDCTGHFHCFGTTEDGFCNTLPGVDTTGNIDIYLRYRGRDDTGPSEREG